MYLWYRPLQAHDLPGCLELLYHRDVYSAEVLARLPQCWKRLIDSGAAITAGVFDLDAPPDRQLVAFGLSVIITDDFAREVRQTVSPESAVVITNALESSHPPVLKPRTIGLENADRGLNLLIFYSGYRAQEGLDFRRLTDKMIESFDFMHMGYHWKEILALVFGDMMKHGYLAGGYRMRADAEEFYRDAPELMPSPLLRPALLGLRREEIEYGEDFTSRLARVFVYQPPRFHFPRGERNLLMYALLGETDEEIAEALCLSPHTVKTRWRRIFACVESCRPDFFPAADGNVPLSKRGPARRPHLLRYLRDHLEELRPYHGGAVS